MTRRVVWLVSAACAFVVPSLEAQDANSRCAALSSLPVQGTVGASLVAAGAFGLPAGVLPGLPLAGSSAVPAVTALPSFCRVEATLRPSSDSDIRVEVWLPQAGWNGKFLAVGNGGWAGNVNYASLMGALSLGYAAASTDTGHTGTPGDGRFALGHPEKLVDFAYRSVHEMTVIGKAVVSAFYGSQPRYSYFSGCSTGGKQGLTEIQRFPADFDGVIAGAPANNWTNQMVQALWVYQATHRSPESFLSPENLRFLHDAVLAACDGADGLKDGLLSEPLSCRFDPKTLECRPGNAEACLSPAQVQAVQQIYDHPKLSESMQPIYPGLSRGSELGWTGLAGPQPFSIPVDYFRYVVFNAPEWMPSNMRLDEATATANRVDKGLINATDPNLVPFFARGGKLLQFHGWTDALIAAESSVDYYTSVVRTVGDRKRVDGSYRLFMAPGMNHCSGGEGPSTFDALSALEQWVERGIAPDSLVASRVRNSKVDRTRPLCPYPQVARYSGSGSIDDAKNFSCRAP